jgi:alpha-beta hydrolase superfamily lysophospholipase
MTSQKPTILIVHGAWHYPSHYSPLMNELEALNYTVPCPQPRTLGSDTHGRTPADEIVLIRQMASDMFEKGHEVVLVGHSYGGIPACAATEGFTTQQRAAQGSSGEFKAIVFLAAFAIPRKGMDLLQAFGGSWAPWQSASLPCTGVNLPVISLEGWQC